MWHLHDVWDDRWNLPRFSNLSHANHIADGWMWFRSFLADFITSFSVLAGRKARMENSTGRKNVVFGWSSSRNKNIFWSILLQHDINVLALLDLNMFHIQIISQAVVCHPYKVTISDLDIKNEQLTRYFSCSFQEFL